MLVEHDTPRYCPPDVIDYEYSWNYQVSTRPSQMTLSPNAEEIWRQSTGIAYEKKSHTSKQTGGDQHTDTETSTDGV